MLLYIISLGTTVPLKDDTVDSDTVCGTFHKVKKKVHVLHNQKEMTGLEDFQHSNWHSPEWSPIF